MVLATESRLATDFAHAIVPLMTKVRDDETIFAIIGDAPVVVFEESTYGTHEFYRARIEITKRLIAERGFTAVCVEDVSRPVWIWHNAETLEFVTWMREYNAAAAVLGRPQADFYGLDHFDDSDDSKEWNARDVRMRDALARVLRHLSACRSEAKAVVWAHNACAGGAFPRFDDRAVSLGFSTYAGAVTAAAGGRAPERQAIVPARGDSYEYLFHTANVPRFFLPLQPYRPKLAGLPRQAQQRAIGAVYSPHDEPQSHYRTSRLIDRYDALFHFDVTRALDSM